MLLDAVIRWYTLLHTVIRWYTRHILFYAVVAAIHCYTLLYPAIRVIRCYVLLYAIRCYTLLYFAIHWGVSLIERRCQGVVPLRVRTTED